MTPRALARNRQRGALDPHALYPRAPSTRVTSRARSREQREVFHVEQPCNTLLQN